MGGPVINLGVNPEALAAVGEVGAAAKAQLSIIKQLENEAKQTAKAGQQVSQDLQKNLTQAYKDLERYKQAARSAKEIQRDAQGAISRTATTGERGSFTSGPQMVNTFSQEERYRFKKQFEEEVGRMRSGADASMRGISARGLSRSPEELLSLLQGGGLSYRALHGIAEGAQFAAQENKLKGLEKLAGGAAGVIGTLAAGLAPTALVAEIASGIMDSARNSKAGQSGAAAQDSLAKAFGSENPFETETEKRHRIARIGRMLGTAIKLPDGGTSLQGGSQMEKTIDRENRLRKEFTDDVIKLSKDPRGRVFLQAQFGQRAFGDPESETDVIVDNMLQRGDNAGEMLGKLRRAAGEMDAHELHQKQADWAVKRSPKLLTEYRNIEACGRLLEEMLIEQSQQWNEE